MGYAKHISTISTRRKREQASARPVTIPQSQPLDPAMVTNRAGGWTYHVGEEQMLRRWLVLGPGAGKGTYYASEEELVLEADDTLQKLLGRLSGKFIVDELVTMRPRVPKAEPSIFVMALLTVHGDDDTKRYIAENIQRVLWTGTDMFMFFGYVDQIRGWGRAIERMANAWYDKDPLSLAKAMTKYRNREGWRHRDVLLKGSVRPNCPETGMVFRYIVSRDKGRADEIERSLEEIFGSGSPAALYLQAVENLWVAAAAGDLDKALQVVADNRLPREVLPTELLSYPETWLALLPHMKAVALTRNLGKMGSLGLLNPGQPALRQVCNRLEDPAWIAAQQLHPAQAITAWSVYRQGHGNLGRLRWDVSPAVMAALEQAFYAGFQNVEPIGQTIVSAVDVSGSMSSHNCVGTPTLNARQAAAVMMMTRKRVEPAGSHISLAFTDELVPLKAQKSWSLEQVVREMDGLDFGATDCAQPMLWALENKVPGITLFEIYSDNETWFGSMHPVEALERYRQWSGVDARLVSMAFAMSRNTVGYGGWGWGGVKRYAPEEGNAQTFDVVGFDTAGPRLVSEFARGEL